MVLSNFFLFAFAITVQNSWRLSLFDETVGLHLLILMTWSSTIQKLINTVPITHDKNQPVSDSTKVIIYPIILITIAMAVTLDRYIPHPDLAGLGSYSSLTWIFLFVVPVNGSDGAEYSNFSIANIALVFLPMIFVLLFPFLIIINIVMRQLWGRDVINLQVHGPILGYALFAIHEIVGIERSVGWFLIGGRTGIGYK